MPSKLEVRADGESAVVIERSFAAPPELVFDCWTKPQFVKQWLTGPDGWRFTVCEIDLRVGGQYRYVWQNTQGVSMGMTGTLKEIVRPEKLVSSEIFDEDWTGGEALVTAVFSREDGGTRVTQTVLYSSAQAREGALASGMTEGMEAGYQRLDRVLEGLTTQKAS
ncbi:ATPase [Devosia geojensis]|uniref:ATPase n=1 Tax=Devosia geojensis TaxID=443610 RepID=A0A0F5FFC1_9HYPH|nr:SRPBCC family protein [Devosia geojensis]KKB06887.1 ATPase [Devosia geojensis]